LPPELSPLKSLWMLLTLDYTAVTAAFWSFLWLATSTAKLRNCNAPTSLSDFLWCNEEALHHYPDFWRCRVSIVKLVSTPLAVNQSAQALLWSGRPLSYCTPICICGCPFVLGFLPQTPFPSPVLGAVWPTARYHPRAIFCFWYFVKTQSRRGTNPTTIPRAVVYSWEHDPMQITTFPLRTTEQLVTHVEKRMLSGSFWGGCACTSH